MQYFWQDSHDLSNCRPAAQNSGFYGQYFPKFWKFTSTIIWVFLTFPWNKSTLLSTWDHSCRFIQHKSAMKVWKFASSGEKFLPGATLNEKLKTQKHRWEMHKWLVNTNFREYWRTTWHTQFYLVNYANMADLRNWLCFAKQNTIKKSMFFSCPNNPDSAHYLENKSPLWNNIKSPPIISCNIFQETCRQGIELQRKSHWGAKSNAFWQTQKIWSILHTWTLNVQFLDK